MTKYKMKRLGDRRRAEDSEGITWCIFRKEFIGSAEEARNPERKTAFGSCKSDLLAPLSPLAKGDEIRFSGSEGVVILLPAKGKKNPEPGTLNW